MFQAQGGNSLPPETLKQLGFDNQVLSQLIDRKAIQAEAERRGLKVTDTEVVEYIRHIPAFRENGQFVGTARYRAVLRAQRPPLREEDFEEDVRTDLLAQKLQAAVTSWVTVSAQETDAEYRRRNEKVKLEVVGFTADQFRAGVTATDAEAQALFTKDPSRYKFGERRKIRYLTVDTQALRQTITPTPQQVEGYYQANLQQFANPEQVHAQHILLKTADKDAAAVRKQIDAILKEAKAPGADFAGARPQVLGGRCQQGQRRRPRVLRPRLDGQAVRGRGVRDGARPDLGRRPDRLRLPRDQGAREARRRPAAARRGARTRSPSSSSGSRRRSARRRSRRRSRRASSRRRTSRRPPARTA